MARLAKGGCLTTSLNSEMLPDNENQCSLADLAYTSVCPSL
jgi:hypothetical protein